MKLSSKRSLLVKTILSKEYTDNMYVHILKFYNEFERNIIWSLFYTKFCITHSGDVVLGQAIFASIRL